MTNQASMERWAVSLHDDFRSTVVFLHNVREKFKCYRSDYSLQTIMQDPNQAARNFVEYCDEVINCIKDKKSAYVRSDEKHLSSELLRLENKVRALEKEKTEALQAKDRAMNRLSELQAKMLKSGNPDIADLGDENRPTNLGQKFKNVYEDEWTDAFTFLTDDRPAGKLKDEEAIYLLYSLVQRCDGITEKAASEQIMKAKELAQTLVGLDSTYLGMNLGTSPTKNPSTALSKMHISKTVGPGTAQRETGMGKGPLSLQTNLPSRDPEVDEQIDGPVRDFCKAVAPVTVNSTNIEAMIQNLPVFGDVPKDILQCNEVVLYLRQCLKLCYLMRTQFPPMLMDFSSRPGDVMNAEKYSSYLTRGPKIAYLVWPPVFLHKDGPLISKGYAEGSK